MNFQQENALQEDLFTVNTLDDKDNRLVEVLDLINDKFGRNTLRIADQGLQDKHALKQEKRSKSFTTKWDELLEVKTKDKRIKIKEDSRDNNQK